MERVIAYVDGYNLYFGMKTSNFKHLYWLDIQKLVNTLLKSHQYLERCKYFTSRVSGAQNKVKRQNTFLDALGTLKDFHLYFGQFQMYPYKCPSCKAINHIPNEKMTDVNMATEIISDAFYDKFDTAILITADSDLCPPIKLINSMFKDKKIIIAFPPNRVSKELQKLASGFTNISKDKLEKSQLPESINNGKGYMLNRPERWK